MMADNQLFVDRGDDDDIFVYTGEQRVPRGVKRVRIAENVDTIPARTFQECFQLIEVEGHDGLKKIEQGVFNECNSLRRMTKMNGVIEIERDAFNYCHALSEIDFDKLEIIGYGAFFGCNSLRSINMPSIRRIEKCAFECCEQLMDAKFGEDLGKIGDASFNNCRSLRRIAIPLKDDVIIEHSAFNCEHLSSVDVVVGGIHKAISSLLLESWKSDMYVEIDRINQVLPNTPRRSRKTAAIQQWIGRVLGKIDHYKSQHYALLKDSMVQLELALWKSKLHEMEGEEFSLLFEFWSLCVSLEKKMTLLVPAIDEEFAGARYEARVTCGANIIIPHVLSFLNDEDVFPLLHYDLATQRD